MLDTNLKHVQTNEQFDKLLSDNKNVMICCGRMGPMCLPVYDAMENLENKYPNVEFRDLEFDAPISSNIRNLKETSGFMGLPFTVYFKDGKVVEATSSIQSKEQIKTILGQVFDTK